MIAIILYITHVARPLNNGTSIANVTVAAQARGDPATDVLTGSHVIGGRG